MTLQIVLFAHQGVELVGVTAGQTNAASATWRRDRPRCRRRVPR
ncbi:hypothetical protein [Streptomyces sp. T21Q-yed]|nr:hypothetical protein [Streptomyces sp. T21Q-yed]MDF3142349.1 hypothetical protein [Streptomyces sp. T21Q-yed]